MNKVEAGLPHTGLHLRDAKERYLMALKGQSPSEGEKQIKMAGERKAEDAQACHEPTLAPTPLRLRTVQEFLVDVSLTPRAVSQRTAPLAPGITKIGYIGWVRHKNLGDEAMFQAITGALTPHHLLPLLPLPGERVLELLGAGGGARFGAVVLGGGTLINPLYLDVAKLALSWKMPFFVAGTGVGSPGFGFSSKGEGDLGEWTEVLRRSARVGVRGPRSAEILEAAGVGGVELIGDPALAFTPPSLPAVLPRPRLILNLGPEYSQRYAGVATVAREFLAKGGEVVGVALGAGDRSCLRQFCRSHSLGKIRIELHREHTLALLKTLAGSQACITVRLHGAILAACVGLPALLVTYRSKCLDYLASMDLKQLGVNASTLEDAACLRDLLEGIDSQPVLRATIHQAALTWADKQKIFFQDICKSLPHPYCQQ